LQQAKNICLDALQWLVDDQVAASVDVITSWASPTQVQILITVTMPDNTVSRFTWAWKAIS
jgi:phage gp46-like protein